MWFDTVVHISCELWEKLGVSNQSTIHSWNEESHNFCHKEEHNYVEMSLKFLEFKTALPLYWSQKNGKGKKCVTSGTYD